MGRASWDEYFMQIAGVVAGHSTCLRHKIGAIIVKDKRILATGYNGAITGTPHCADIGCLRDELKIPSGQRIEICRGLHAEQNAVLFAVGRGASLKDATIYCTHQPCILCTKIIVQVGIKRIVYQEAYPDKMAVELCKQTNTELVKIKPQIRILPRRTRR